MVESKKITLNILYIKIWKQSSLFPPENKIALQGKKTWSTNCQELKTKSNWSSITNLSQFNVFRMLGCSPLPVFQGKWGFDKDPSSPETCFCRNLVVTMPVITKMGIPGRSGQGKNTNTQKKYPQGTNDHMITYPSKQESRKKHWLKQSIPFFGDMRQFPGYLDRKGSLWSKGARV